VVEHLPSKHQTQNLPKQQQQKPSYGVRKVPSNMNNKIIKKKRNVPSGEEGGGERLGEARGDSSCLFGGYRGMLTL
jgi:hypothetical protein